MQQLTAILCIALFLLFIAGTVAGDEYPYRQDSQSQTKAAGAATMEELLAKVRTDFEGHILKVELENETDNTSWIYEVKVLNDDGSVAEIEYDAYTLQVLNVEQGSSWRQWSDEDD